MVDASKIWMPDTFFRNEKIGAFHDILQPNLYIRVFPDGDVLYSIRSGTLKLDILWQNYVNISHRVSLTCACSMHLALFPMDEQTCRLNIASCKLLFFPPIYE